MNDNVVNAAINSPASAQATTSPPVTTPNKVGSPNMMIRVGKLAWRPVRAVLRSPLILLGGTVGAFIRGVRIINNPGPASDANADVIKAPAGVLYIGLFLLMLVSAAHPYLPSPKEGTPAYYALEISRLFVAELGVALVVAFVIAWGIDAQARAREERRQELERKSALERERRLTQDVFRSVLGIQHSSAYVQKVIETNLDQKIIRRSINMMYSLVRLSDEDGQKLDVNPMHFMFLDQAASFEFENLSSDPQPIDVKFAVPARHGKKLRAASEVLSATINGQEQPVGPALQNDDHSDSKIYIWKHQIEPFGKLPVAITTRVVKEDSDTDVWSSYFPCTEGMTLQVNAPSGLHIGLRNNTCSKAVAVIPPTDGGMAAWKISGPILPNSGVVFYWRTLEHDGDVPASQQHGENESIGLTPLDHQAIAKEPERDVPWWRFWRSRNL